MSDINDKLHQWQAKVDNAKARLKNSRREIDKREQLYKGSHDMRPIVTRKSTAPEGEAYHVFNIIAENIESEIDVNIPQPKVTAVRPEDEYLARMIEDFCRSELDRQQFEEINDLVERIVPVQGGSYFQVGWDNTKHTHTTIGELYTQVRHPKQVIPQPGVYSGVDDMDYIALEIPVTKQDIKRKYGIDVTELGESAPEVKDSDGGETYDDMVTQTIVYYRSTEGIGRYSYVGETVLEDNPDYMARQRRRCAKCGAPEDGAGAPMDEPTLNGSYPGETPEKEAPEDGTLTSGRKRREKGVCPYCGSRKFEVSSDDYRILPAEHVCKSGKIIPAYEEITDELGNVTDIEPVRLPYYKVDIYPIVLQRNISVFGELLGESDVDKIADQQNTMNHINKIIIDRIAKAGTKITLPADPDVDIEEENGDVIRLTDVSQKSYIDTFDFTGNLEYQILYRNLLYEEPRQVLGITDSLQGRRDTTATSAVAKEFSAQQSAGRLESKRRLKNAAYARLFELMFKLALANMDEPRPVRRSENGKTIYSEFDPMEFYEQDDAGQWYINDRFLFSTDSAAPLASNREAMWKEVTAQFSSGSYGDPTTDETRLLYWGLMEELHYPLAAAAKRGIEERIQKEREILDARMQVQAQAAQIQPEQQDMSQLPADNAGAVGI